MKRYFIVLVLLIISISANSQPIIGLRDNQYAQIGYELNKSAFILLEESIYSEHFSNQKIRFIIGFQSQMGKLDINLAPYISSLWGGGYYDCGCFLNGRLSLLNTFALEFILNPHFDSHLKYMTCMSLGLKSGITKTISIFLRYNTIPEYRMNERRLRCGFEFTIDNLWVKPEISLPLEGQIKSCRVYCSFVYRFGS